MRCANNDFIVVMILFIGPLSLEKPVLGRIPCDTSQELRLGNATDLGVQLISHGFG